MDMDMGVIMNMGMDVHMNTGMDVHMNVPGVQMNVNMGGMGVMSKMGMPMMWCGVDGSFDGGKMKIYYDKTTYYPGEMVTGHACIQVFTMSHFTHLELRIKGVEKTCTSRSYHDPHTNEWKEDKDRSKHVYF